LIPYRESQRQKRLDREQVVRAALALLDEVGLDELTMRRLAERLGIQAASLYRHVRDKDELLALLADEITGEIPIVEARGSWKDQLLEMGRNTRRGLLAHRDGARLLASTAPFGLKRLRHIEAVLRSLRSAGLTRRDAARTAHHLNNLVTEFVADEGRFDQQAAALGMSRRKMLADARKYFSALPKDQFPTIVEMAGDLVEDDVEGLFEFGLQIWIRAIEQLSRASGRRSK
jgi:TetR/AcrR family tetracycline transcriptional repressor